MAGTAVRARRAKHRPGCEHCYRVTLLGRDFGTWRAAWEGALEQEANGYAAEEEQFRASNAAPTFKAYLIAMTGQPWPMSGRQPRRYFAA
jgi:hypothetical protein